MSQYSVQVAPTEMFPVESVEFFNTLEEAESYAEHLLEHIFPDEVGLDIHYGAVLAANVVRLPKRKVIFSFRTQNFF